MRCPRGIWVGRVGIAYHKRLGRRLRSDPVEVGGSVMVGRDRHYVRLALGRFFVHVEVETKLYTVEYVDELIR